MEPTAAGNYYPMTKEPRGVCLIVNNFDYRSRLPKLRHAVAGEQSVRDAFSNLFFTVESRQNLTANRIRHVVAQLADRDHSQAQCFVCYIIAHGDHGVILGVDGAEVHLLELAFFFMKENSTLRDKPKVFILDVCGRKHEFLMPASSSNFVDFTNQMFKHQFPQPVVPDFLFGFATVPNSTDIKNAWCEDHNSLFARTFSHNLSNSATLLDLVQIFGMMNNSLASAILGTVDEIDRKMEEQLNGQDGKTRKADSKPHGDENEADKPATSVLQECEIRSTLRKRLLMLHEELGSIDEKKAKPEKKPQAKPKTEGSIMLIGGTNTGSSWKAQSVCEQFFPGENKWCATADLGLRRYEAAAAVVGGLVFVSGGLDEQKQALSSVEQYDSVSNRWLPQADLINPRHAHAMVAVDRAMVVVGGNDNSVDRYDLKSKIWSFHVVMSGTRIGLSCVSLPGGLLLIGGRDEHGKVLNSCELLDVKQKTWSAAGQLKQERCFAAAAVWNTTAFIFGGEDDNFNSLNTVEQYDSAADRWQLLDSRLHVGRFGLAAAALDGTVYLAGGRNDRQILSTVETFHASAKRFANELLYLSDSLCSVAATTM